MKEFNIGDSDFKSLIENNYYYIDKTMFIREVIKAQKQVLLIPRPRRFGKTMNIRMLKYTQTKMVFVYYITASQAEGGLRLPAGFKHSLKSVSIPKTTLG